MSGIFWNEMIRPARSLLRYAERPTTRNFSEDLDITVREDRKVNIPVHAGFDLAARAIYEDVKPYLKTGYKTYLTGHSLGGAVAAILTIYMIEDGVEVVRVVTFGQPRFTTADGVKRLNFLPLARVVDENDIVPMVPPASAINLRFGPYEHVGPEVILLEGRDIVYLPSHNANRISLGEFWRSLSFADLKDHEMKKYLKRIADKTKGAHSSSVQRAGEIYYVCQLTIALRAKKRHLPVSCTFGAIWPMRKRDMSCIVHRHACAPSFVEVKRTSFPMP